MVNYIVKNDTKLVLFAVQNLNLKNNYRNLILWNKFIESFRYDDEVVCSLLFIDHPTEFYIGVSVRSDDPALLDKKIVRYSEGLAYLLIYHFPEANIRALETDECLNVVMNIASLNVISEDLTMLDSAELPPERVERVKIVFVRAINPRITLDKFFEFYEKHYRENPSSIERRMGVKSVLDERILAVLQNPVLAYSFSFFPSKIQLEKEIQKENVCNLPEDNFIDMFLDTMSVPDNIVGLIYEAESVSDLFDNRYVSLVPPKNVAELILIK